MFSLFWHSGRNDHISGGNQHQRSAKKCLNSACDQENAQPNHLLHDAVACLLLDLPPVWLDLSNPKFDKQQVNSPLAQDAEVLLLCTSWILLSGGSDSL